MIEFGKAHLDYPVKPTILDTDGQKGSVRKFSFPCLARGSFEMRHYIISSIANEVRRYSAAAVDMSRMVLDPAGYQWHVQLCTVVQPVGDAHQRRHDGLLTSGNFTSGIANSLFGKVEELLKPFAIERAFVETTGANGSNCQQCPSTLGSRSGLRAS